MDKFLETYNLPKINQVESKNLSKEITTSEIKTVIKKLPTNKSSGPMATQVNFTKHYKN